MCSLVVVDLVVDLVVLRVMHKEEARGLQQERVLNLQLEGVGMEVMPRPATVERSVVTCPKVTRVAR